jgi:hypothetical protein
MRRSFAPLLGKRARFSAIFAGISHRGHVVLEDVCVYADRKVPYVWIEAQDWKERLPIPGSEVCFQATVRSYWAETRREFDFGLTDISEVRV